MSSSERVQISIRVPNDMIQAFERVGAVLDRDKTWMMVEAFQFYLDREGKDILAAAEGIAAVDRGETVEWGTALNRIDAAIDRGKTTSVKKAG